MSSAVLYRCAGAIDTPGQGGRWASGDFRETRRSPEMEAL